MRNSCEQQEWCKERRPSSRRDQGDAPLLVHLAQPTTAHLAKRLLAIRIEARPAGSGSSGAGGALTARRAVLQESAEGGRRVARLGRQAGSTGP